MTLLRIDIISETLIGYPTASNRARGRFNSAVVHRLIAKNRPIRALTIGLMARMELALLAGHKQPDQIAQLRRARLGRESLLSGNEAFTVYSLAHSQSRLDGEMAEVGVYQGCSAKLISMAGGGRPLHLFEVDPFSWSVGWLGSGRFYDGELLCGLVGHG